MVGIAGLGSSVDSSITLDYPTGVDAVPSGGSSTNLWTVINTAINSAAGILGTRYAVPQLNPGQLIQGNGQVLYQSQPGSGFPTLSTLGVGTGGSSMLWLGGAALIALLALKR